MTAVVATAVPNCVLPELKLTVLAASAVPLSVASLVRRSEFDEPVSSFNASVTSGTSRTSVPPLPSEVTATVSALPVALLSGAASVMVSARTAATNRQRGARYRGGGAGTERPEVERVAAREPADRARKPSGVVENDGRAGPHIAVGPGQRDGFGGGNHSGERENGTIGDVDCSRIARVAD